MREGVTIVSAATALVTALWLAPLCFSQTTSTGALTGVTTDASRAVIPGVEMTRHVFSAFGVSEWHHADFVYFFQDRH